METSTRPVLRPLRLGELFDQAIRIYRRNFLTFVGMLAIVYIPAMVLQAGVSTLLLIYMSTADRTQLIFSPAYWLFLLGSFASGIVSSILVSGLGASALTNATKRSYLNQKIGIIDSYRQLGTSWLQLIFVSFILAILSFVVFVWSIIPVVGWFTGLGVLFFLGSVVEQLLAPITVIEKKTWFDPILRAWDLVRRRAWWMAGVVLLIALFQTLVVTGPTLLVQYGVGLILGRGQSTTIIAALLATVFGGLIQLIVFPIMSIIRTLIYFDLRIRTEGFDLALATVESTENAEIELADIPIPASTQSWLTWDDIIRFVIVSVALFGVIALLIGVSALFVTLFSALR